MLLYFLILKLSFFFHQSAKNSKALPSDEEMENTKKFLALTAASEETVGE